MTALTAQDLRGAPLVTRMHARLSRGGYHYQLGCPAFPELTVSRTCERRGEPAERRIFVDGEPARDLRHAAHLLNVMRARPDDADEPALEEAS